MTYLDTSEVRMGSVFLYLQQSICHLYRPYIFLFATDIPRHSFFLVQLLGIYRRPPTPQNLSHNLEESKEQFVAGLLQNIYQPFHLCNVYSVVVLQGRIFCSFLSVYIFHRSSRTRSLCHSPSKNMAYCGVYLNLSIYLSYHLYTTWIVFELPFHSSFPLKCHNVHHFSILQTSLDNQEGGK